MSEDLLKCSHPRFEATVNVNRIAKEDGGDIYMHTADIRIRCSICHTDMAFEGLPNGIGLNFPTVSVDGKVARMPINPLADFEIGKIKDNE
jgi:hypothetical protein